MKIKIITFLFVSCIALGLEGCVQNPLMYRVNVQQGNVITPEMLQQLRIGMTRQAVADLLGLPLLADTFNDNRWTYQYTFKPGKGKFIEKKVVIYFRNERVIRINTKNY